MADYADVETARAADGLRLVLTAGVPGAPWTEAAKAVFEVKNIPFLRVAQQPGQTDDALREWTGVVNAPIAVYEDERPRPGWREIVHLAERLAPEPRLIPPQAWDRVLLFGLGGELMDEDGLAWCRRLMMFDAMQRPGEGLAGFAKLRGKDYGYTPEAAARAPARVVQILETFAEQWRRQRGRGSRYLLGTELSALDLYWATMAAIVAPLPHEQCPMPDGLRASYEDLPASVRTAVDPALLEHRDFIYENWLTLPVDT